MNICVFCSASDVHKQYNEAARDLGARIARAGHTYVYGGADFGLMKMIADTVEENGGTIVGVLFEHIKDQARKGTHEVIIEPDLASRKATLISRADAFIVLAGGIGTLDEVGEILELKQQRLHGKPIVIVNTDGFYEGFKQQLERMETERFLRQPMRNLLTFVDTPQQAMEYIERNATG